MSLTIHNHPQIPDHTPSSHILTGHTALINAVRFSPSAEIIASAGNDRTIRFWSLPNFTATHLKTPTAILDLRFSSDGLYAASTNDAALYDIQTGEKIRRFRGHRGVVNSVQVAREGGRMVTAGDDGRICIWDPRQKKATTVLSNDGFACTTATFSADGHQIFSGSIDNDILAWDLRTSEVEYILKGHAETITCVAVSPDGNWLLSNAMDSTVRTWNIKPYAAVASRVHNVFTGAPSGFERNLTDCVWSPSGDHVMTGCADRSVMIWNALDGQMEYKLGGHKGCCNTVDWSPVNDMIVSGSTDKTLLLTDLTKVQK